MWPEVIADVDYVILGLWSVAFMLGAILGAMLTRDFS